MDFLEHIRLSDVQKGVLIGVIMTFLITFSIRNGIDQYEEYYSPEEYLLLEELENQIEELLREEIAEANDLMGIAELELSARVGRIWGSEENVCELGKRTMATERA